MEVRLLGPLEVVTGGRSLPLGGPRQRAVFALLAIHANDVLFAERIADEIWAGEPPRTVQATLQGYVFHLRKALGDGPAAIETRKPGYVLRIDPELVDARRAERLIAEAATASEQGRPAVASALLHDALALWRGEPLADFAFEPFAETEIARLTELRLAALDARIDADLVLGHHEQLVPELDALVREHPLRETLRGHLMLALHRSGRTAEALRTYTEGRELLAEELGIDPSLALQRLERSILMQDPEVEPAPRGAGPPATGNLPAPTTSFIARENELREVAAHLGRYRLVTLTGPGGTGKTRLALETANRAGGSYTDGTWWIELAGLNDPALVATAIAGALGVSDAPERTPLDGVIDLLRDRTALLVVDNCEHLVEAAAGVTASILRACPRVRVLATSREALGVEGEFAWPVPTLAIPDPAIPATFDEIVRHAAVALFLERAGTARPGFAADDANVAAIVAICRRLDGMPLAIELAAARLRVLTVDQIATRLDDRFRLLAASSRGGESRHRTLRATVDWSYESLDDAERLLFARLSVFAGAFTLEHVEAVCSGDGIADTDVLDLLSGLVNKSMVATGPGNNGFRLLETLREYGWERAGERGEHDRLRAHHSAVFTDIALHAKVGLRGSEARSWLDRLEAQYDDSRSALEWLVSTGNVEAAAELASALFPFWTEYFGSEGREWLTRLLECELPAPHRLALLVGAAGLAINDGDVDTSSRIAREGIDLAASVGDEAARGQLLTDLAECARATGTDLEHATDLAEEAVAVLHEVGAAWEEAYAIRLLSLLARDRGDFDAADRHGARCYDLFVRSGNVAHVAGAAFMFGGVARDRGEYQRADDLLQQSLVQFREMRVPWGIADATQRIGAIALVRGDVDRAIRLATEALRIAEESRHARAIVESMLLLADAAVARGDLARAEAIADRVASDVQERKLLRYLVETTIARARIALHHRHLDEAASLAGETLEHCAAFATTRGKDAALTIAGLARVRLGDAAGGLTQLEEALDLAQGSHNVLGAARALEALAEAAQALGDFERAARYLSAARVTRAGAGIVLVGPERKEHGRTFAAVRAGLDGGAFCETWLAEWEGAEELDLRISSRRTTKSSGIA